MAYVNIEDLDQCVYARSQIRALFAPSIEFMSVLSCTILQANIGFLRLQKR